jgi:hypothetical protein
MQQRSRARAGLLIAFLVLFNGVVAAWQVTTSIGKKNDAAALEATDEVLKSVSRLRGLEVKDRVKSGLKTRDQIELAVLRDLDENTTPEEFAATSRALTKLGLIPKEFQLREYVVKLLREQVAGFYEPKSREFYLAAWLPISEQKTVIAHELVHALQDQHFDLRRFEKWPKGDSDAELAAHALVEGDATVVMLLYSAEQAGAKLDLRRIGPLTTMLLQQSGAEDASKYPVLARAPAVLRESLQFPYVYGSGFVQEVLNRQSWQALNASYHSLPASTEQVMHPEKFIERDDPVKIQIADVLSALGKDWTRVDADVNGEFGYSVVLSQFIDKNEARRAAAGWDGDRYHLYENKRGGNVILTQYTTWDTRADAAEFFQAYCRRTEKRYYLSLRDGQPTAARQYETDEGMVSVELRGNDVVIIEGARGEQQLARLSGLLWQSKKSTLQKPH